MRIAACNLDTIASRHNAANAMLVYDNLMGRAKCPGIRGVNVKDSGAGIAMIVLSVDGR